jgi:nitrite reductase (NADH) small subunit
MPFIRLCSTSQLPAEGEAAEITVGDRIICVANVDGQISAMDNVCLHRGGPLGQGLIEGNKIVCPWHGWMFDIQTGAASHDNRARVAVYPVVIEGEDVMIDFE